MNNRFAFAAGLAVSALAFGCVAAVASPTGESLEPAPVIDVPAVELEATVVPAPVATSSPAPAPVMTTDPLPLEEAPAEEAPAEEAPAEEAPAEEAPATLTYGETVALFGESFAVGDVIVCPAGWTVVTDTTAEGFQWAACM